MKFRFPQTMQQWSWALFLFTLLGTTTTRAALPPSSTAPELAVISPTSRTVFQRDLFNTAIIPVWGNCPITADSVQARLKPRQIGQGQPTDWVKLKLHATAGHFSGELLTHGGWYDLEVRASANEQPLSLVTIERIGVGEVFVVVGHSVAAGQDVNISGAIDDRVNTVALDKEAEVFQSYLKKGNPQFLPSPVFSHYGTGVIPAPFGSGNYFWARFGEQLAQKENVPVLIYNAAFGGTSLEHWAKSAEGIAFDHSFVRSAIRMPYINLANALAKYIPLTGLRAILADQGQNDWTEKQEEVIFKNYRSWIERARLDLAYPQLPIVINRQTPFLRDAQVRRAQERVSNLPDCFPGPNYDLLAPEDRPDGIHLSRSGQTNAAQMWASALDKTFFGNAKPWLPRFATNPSSEKRIAIGNSQELNPAPVGKVEITDQFWAPKLQVYREKTIPHSWFYMQWELRALRKAAGQIVTGDLNGTWGEANLYKFLETVAYSLAQKRDPQLEQRVDEIVDLLALAQQPDGYLHYFVTNSKKMPWDPEFLDGSHDGYVLGHMIEAAIEYHAATGKSKFLDLARRAADQAYEHFLGPHGQPGFCGHAELEMALMELYRVSGEPRYVELATAFVEWRGRHKVKPYSETPRAYFQDEVPLDQQQNLDGHAVRAIFFATGVADLALETGQSRYRLAANRFWDSTTRRRITITGSVGPRQEHEAFGEDYELPNNGYYESCASCGLADFAQRIFLLERHSQAADILEQVLYNAVPHGMELTGTNSYYQNPLTDHDRPRYNSWVCCPPNLSRTLLQIGRYAYAQSDRELYVNLFVGSTWHANVEDQPIDLEVTTDYPWDGHVRFQVRTPKPTRFTLCLRQPGWCEASVVQLNAQALSDTPSSENGYLRIDRIWSDKDQVELILDMPVRLMAAHPNIKDCQGKVAIQRGPIVYGFESLDNEGTAQITLAKQPEFRAEYRADFLGGITIVKSTTAQGKSAQAIPFFALANRSKAAQEVWVQQKDLKVPEGWWLGKLYRPTISEK